VALENLNLIASHHENSAIPPALSAHFPAGRKPPFEMDLDGSEFVFCADIGALGDHNSIPHLPWGCLAVDRNPSVGIASVEKNDRIGRRFHHDSSPALDHSRLRSLAIVDVKFRPGDDGGVLMSGNLR